MNSDVATVLSYIHRVNDVPTLPHQTLGTVLVKVLLLLLKLLLLSLHSRNTASLPWLVFVHCTVSLRLFVMNYVNILLQL